MIRLASVLLALPLIACTATPVPQDRLGVQCNADRVQPLVGREATTDVVTRANERSGGRTVRLIKPGEAGRLRFRAGRLNLGLANVNTITAARCG